VSDDGDAYMRKNDDPSIRFLTASPVTNGWVHKPHYGPSHLLSRCFRCRVWVVFPLSDNFKLLDLLFCSASIETWDGCDSIPARAAGQCL